jgi:hydrogenase maturation protease
MRSMAIAIGNPLRADDGVAHTVLDRLGGVPGLVRRDVLQLTPEIAAEIAGFQNVVFIDADVAGADVYLAAVEPRIAIQPLTHQSTPADIAGLAKRLYGFTGRALYCRIPARTFGYGEGLSEAAQAFAEGAVIAINSVLSGK